MTLTAHAIVGAGISSAFGLMPGGAFGAGFLSHFLLDRLPHWDYNLKSATIDEANPLNNNLPICREAIGDFAKIGFDFFLGLALALLFFSSNGQSYWPSILLGALGGMLPDGLQFLYFKFRREPLTLFFRFHAFMHAKTEINDIFGGLCLTGGVLILALVLGNWYFFIW